MAKKQGQKAQPQERKHFKNPTDSWWGKVIIWILIFGMVGAVIVGFILSIVNGNA
ncbi:MAG: hypothetical protein WC225_05700 [Acholeplasmataceae bacterium]|nr:hypothetical protein [Acholeplasmataceae bacterium]